MSRQSRLVPRESDEQRLLVQWLRVRNLPFTAVFAGLDRRTAGRAKTLGHEIGFPDLLVLKSCESGFPGSCKTWCPGVAIELKSRNGGVTTPEQRGWHRILSDMNWHVVVAKGFDHAVEELQRLGL